MVTVAPAMGLPAASVTVPSTSAVLGGGVFSVRTRPLASPVTSVWRSALARHGSYHALMPALPAPSASLNEPSSPVTMLSDEYAPSGLEDQPETVAPEMGSPASLTTLPETE